MARKRKQPDNVKVGRPIIPNMGIEVAYRKKLEALIDEMYRSILWWIGAEYKREQEKIIAYNEPDEVRGETLADVLAGNLAEDASPANAMLAALRTRFFQWRKNFDDKADLFARWFANRTEKAASSSTGQSIAKAMGITVKFRPTRAMNNAMASIINENVALIKSIPHHCFEELEGLVMRSVRAGRDIGGLVEDIEKRYEVTRRRAQFIARDQNNKATQSLARVRMQELGQTEAMWLHITRSNKPRKTHVEMDGKTFDLSKGMYDSAVGKWIQPGELPNCRCMARPVLKIFDYETFKNLGKKE